MTNDKLSSEVIRVLKTMPLWNPAKHEGEIVRSVYDISMVVKMRDRVEEEIREFTEQKRNLSMGWFNFCRIIEEDSECPMEYRQM